MTTKNISYSELKDAIRVAFDGDQAVYSLYDPNVSVTTIDELTEDVFRKITEWDGLSLYAVYVGDELAGYFVNVKNQLISFGLALKYRVDKYLKRFFEKIKYECGNDFFVFLWQKNVRGIKWVMKNGLVETFSDNNIIKLQCQ